MPSAATRRARSGRRARAAAAPRAPAGSPALGNAPASTQRRQARPDGKLVMQPRGMTRQHHLFRLLRASVHTVAAYASRSGAARGCDTTAGGDAASRCAACRRTLRRIAAAVRAAAPCCTRSALRRSGRRGDGCASLRTCAAAHAAPCLRAHGSVASFRRSSSEQRAGDHRRPRVHAPRVGACRAGPRADAPEPDGASVSSSARAAAPGDAPAPGRPRRRVR